MAIINMYLYIFINVNMKTNQFTETIKNKYKSEDLTVIESFREIFDVKPRSMKISEAEEFEKRSKEITKKNKKVGRTAINLIRTKNYFLFMMLVMDKKIELLIDSLINSLNKENHIAFALSGRSLLEHAGTICYVNKKADKVLSSLVNQTSYEKIKEILETLQGDLNKIYYGTRFFQDKQHMQSIHINDFIRTLDERYHDANKAYGFLCDFVHPNFGSNILVSDGHLGEGFIDKRFDKNKEIINQMISIVSTTVNNLREEIRSFAKLGMLLDDYIEKSLHKNSSIGIIFKDIKAEDVVRYDGDGSNKENAIFFTTARTPPEHIEMQIIYLEENNINYKGREARDIKDGYIYDAYQTDNGEIWFKVPVIKL